MAGLGHQGGKYKPVGTPCPWVARQLARQDIPAEFWEVFTQAIARMDAEIPHFGDKHGVPPEDALQDIEFLEEALAASGIDVHVSKLLRYITNNTCA